MHFFGLQVLHPIVVVRKYPESVPSARLPIANAKVTHYYETCRETKDAMKQSAILQAGISSGKLKVLTLYPDEDVELWQAHLEELSDEWINGYDKGQVLTRNALYDLSAIPSFYLLDKNKKVLLKDADWSQVTQLLSVQ